MGQGQYTAADIDSPTIENRSALPPLPAGYKLDNGNATPPLPAGYKLDTAVQRGVSTTMPMIAPDGSTGDIPVANMQAAIKAGFKQAVKMTSPDGQIGYIPSERVSEATKAGFKAYSPQVGRYSAADIDDGDLSVTSSAPLPGQENLSVVDSQPLPTAKPSLAERFVNSMPGIGLVHQASGAVSDWAQRKAGEYAQQQEAYTAKTGQSPSFLQEAASPRAAMDLLSHTAGMVRGATSPIGIATTAATIAAPEVMGPALIAHGAYNIINGWGDLKNPDVAERELTSAAEVAGGAATGAAALKAGGGPVTQTIRQKVSPSTQLATAATEDLKTAIPPSRSAPYADIDMQKARPYLEAEHGNTPIDSVEGLRDAADSAIGKIEARIGQQISKLPNARFQTNVTQDVTKALQSNQRGQSFVSAGLKDLEDFNFDQPKTLADADAIRRQLNLENQAVLAKNDYKVAVARASDPGFAAREAAAESLRDGIYQQLAANGMPEARTIRLDEGSLIKVRNSAQAQLYAGDKVVRGTASSSPLRQAGKALIKSGTTAAGAAIGGWPGAIAGREIGEPLGNALTPPGLTRNALIERSFSRPTANPAQITPATTSVPAAAISSMAAQRDLYSPVAALKALVQ